MFFWNSFTLSMICWMLVICSLILQLKWLVSWLGQAQGWTGVCRSFSDGRLEFIVCSEPSSHSVQFLVTFFLVRKGGWLGPLPTEELLTSKNTVKCVIREQGWPTKSSRLLNTTDSIAHFHLSSPFGVLERRKLVSLEGLKQNPLLHPHPQRGEKKRWCVKSRICVERRAGLSCSVKMPTWHLPRVEPFIHLLGWWLMSSAVIPSRSFPYPSWFLPFFVFCNTYVQFGLNTHGRLFSFHMNLF